MKRGNHYISYLACIASLSFIAVHLTCNNSKQSNGGVGTSDNDNQTFHQTGFGGIKNIAHAAGAKRYRRSLSAGSNGANVIIPVSAVEHAIPSLGRENIENLHGHYVHDEHHSPFASFLYDRPKVELEQEQKEYLEKMEKVRQEWGAWDFKDEFTDVRPIANFNKTPYKDMMNSQFPKKSWQMDEKYCRSLIGEGRKLVSRIREGIYAEYGHATKDLKVEEIEERNKLFEVHITDELPRGATGVAWITRKGFDMLSRKLLHHMITNDEFYYIMGGHSAAAGHGNNFHQQYTMQFANIMEPVFHKLGMRLIARNLAMGGLGTIHFSLGAATLYGETDFLMWDSGMTERIAGDKDLFNKQGLLGGERVPILFGAGTGNLQIETGDNLWYGDRMKGEGIMPKTTGLEQVETLPFATRYQSCEANVMDLCSDRSTQYKYHDSCWEPRSDYTPPLEQDAHAGSQVSWHPGDRMHQFNSRKMILLFLDAFDEAFNVWENGIESDGFPLRESYWHVGEEYEKIRSQLTSYLNGEGLGTTDCEERWATLPGLDKVCRVSLSGMSEFTPINLGLEANSVTAHVKSAPNGYHPRNKFTEPEYTGVDVLPLQWKIPQDQIDLHAIAIASTYAPPELDHSIVDDDDEDAEDAEDSRRSLRRAVSRTSSTLTFDNEKQSSITPSHETQPRTLSSADEVIPGLGWQRDVNAMQITGYCDGSPMSMCRRAPDNKCLLYGHSDNHGALQGNGLSGWLVVTIPKVKHGLIFAKLHWWTPRGDTMEITKGWTEVNNGEGYGRRQLKAQPKEWPADFEVDVAVNGKIVKTYNYDEFRGFSKEMAHNQGFYPLVDDENLVAGDKPEEVELGLRIRSESNPFDASFELTHIYYA